MLKEIIKLRSTFPKYTVIEDANIVVTYMGAIVNNSSLLLKDLTSNLCILLYLLSGQRCLTIASLDLKFSDYNNEKFTFAIHEVKKTTKPGEHQQPIESY